MSLGPILAHLSLPEVFRVASLSLPEVFRGRLRSSLNGRVDRRKDVSLCGESMKFGTVIFKSYFVTNPYGPSFEKFHW